MCDIIAEAPEELRILLDKDDNRSNVKNLYSTIIHTEMLTKALAHLMSAKVTT